MTVGFSKHPGHDPFSGDCTCETRQMPCERTQDITVKASTYRALHEYSSHYPTWDDFFLSMLKSWEREK